MELLWRVRKRMISPLIKKLTPPNKQVLRKSLVIRFTCKSGHLCGKLKSDTTCQRPFYVDDPSEVLHQTQLQAIEIQQLILGSSLFYVKFLLTIIFSISVPAVCAMVVKPVLMGEVPQKKHQTVAHPIQILRFLSSNRN